jgi:hypothetical protein
MSMPILPGQVRLFTTLAALIIVGVDLYQTYIAVAPHVPGDPSLWWASFPRIAGLVMAHATDLMVIAICVLLVGRGIYYFFIRDSRIWQNVIGVIVCTYVGEVTLRASRILLEPTPPTSIADKLVVELLLSVVVGLAVTVITILVTFKLSKRFDYYFKKTGAEKGEES